ncbi:MAG TPA: Ig-like domain-containing protein [Tepidisphaeraceae bacterium]|jgi:fibronectin type 3 domain-containing protein|nr:Ig-like domain-containing protein [Tepidisphaeraceae bacterium]
MAFHRRNPSVAASKIRRAASVERLEIRRLLSAAPTVNTVTPANGAKGIALNAPITATVNLPNGGLDPNTVIGANVSLYPINQGSTNSADVPAVVNTTGGGDAIILTPTINLQPNTQYTFAVTAGVKDIHGDAMTPYSESFTTGNTLPIVNQNIAFSKTVLPTTSGTPFTDMQFGPDGKLYASTEDGRIFRYPVNADGTLGTPQVITSLQTANGGNRLISGFAFDPASTASNLKIWVSNTFYALSGATNGQNFTSKLTVMSGPDLATVTDAIIDLPRSVADHVNDQPIFQPGTQNLFFCQAGQNAYGAPDTTWGNRPETELSAAILEVKTNLLNLSKPALNVLTPDAKSDAGVALGGTYDPTAAGAPLTIYATGIRNAFGLFFDSTGQLWAPANGSSSGGNTPAGDGAPALMNVQQVEVDSLFKVVQGAYYGHPNPIRGQYVLDDGNPSTGAIPGLAFTAYPSGTNPDPNYQPPNYIFGVHNSPDGMIQYSGNAFGGALDGKFLVAEYSAGDDIVVLTPDANDNIIGGLASTATSPGPDRSVTGFSGFTNPVTLIENPANGFIYVSELGGSKITLLKPSNVAPTISVSTSVVAFNTIATGNAGAGPSRVQTVTLTNTGADALTLGTGAISIINNPASTTQNAADYTIANQSNLPGTLNPGQSTTIQITYIATATGIQSALLQITSAGASTPTVNVTLNGIGTTGLYGYQEPSLVQVLRANNIPTIVGAGPNDVNINTPTYPQTPDASSQEVALQEMVVAGPGPVTIRPLASFDTNSSPAVRLGYYSSGNSASGQELFTIGAGDAQTVYPTALGSTSFNPGTGPFSLYGIFPGTTVAGGGTDIHYSEDALNTPLDPVNPRKFRFFPLENPDGSVVPNAYIVAAEDYNSSTYNSFVNFVGIIQNVMAAPNATKQPQIGVVNLTGPASAPQLAFNRIQTPNPTVADVVHDSNTIQINNTGTAPLTIYSLTLSDTTNWTLVNPPTFPIAIAVGGSLDVTIKFVAQTVPTHTVNETNTKTTTNGVSVTKAGGVWNGTLTVNSSDPTTPATVLKLAGYWQDQTEHENEPSLVTIVNLLYGYGSKVSPTTPAAPDYPNSGATAIDYGGEVASGLWNPADSTQPVAIQYLASFHNEYDTSTPPAVTSAFLGYYLSGSGNVTDLFRQVNNTSQSLLPAIMAAGGQPLATSFTPSGAFGFDVDGEKSQDSLNTTDITTYSRSGHAIRFFPLLDSHGNVAPNTWIMAMDYQNTSIDNSDFQDNVYLVSNITPSASPATPADLQVSQGTAGVNVQWAPVSSAASYNVLRSVNGGSYAQLNSSALTATSYTDLTVPAGNAVSYEVVAVNAAKVASTPATGSITLSAAETNPPTLPPAAPTSIQGDGSSGMQIALTWTASASATAYIVQREGPGTTSFTTLTGADTVNSYTDADPALVPGGVYTYQIAATNANGTSAFALSQPITLVAPLLPATPGNVVADGSSGTQVVVSWTAGANDATYNVLRQGPGDTSFIQVATGLTGAIYNDGNITAGATYLYEVDAANAAATSAPSAPATVTLAQPGMPPLPPTALGADASSGTHVLLTWSLSAGASSYSVSRMGPTDTTFVPIATGLTLPAYTDAMVSAGSAYVYEVDAVNTSGASAFSSPTTVVIPQPAPAAPTNVKADGSSGSQVVITWDPDGAAATFNVDRQTVANGPFLQVANSLTATMFIDTSVTAGSAYTYRVDAVNSTGLTSSAAVTVTLPQPQATLDVTLGKGANKSVVFTAANGTIATVSLTGAGTAVVHFTADSISQAAGKSGVVVSGANVAVANISMTGASAATMLKVTAKGGAVPLGDITSDGSLGGINAKSAVLIGDLSVPGSVGKVILGAANASTFSVGALQTLQVGSASGVTITSAGPIKTITAGTWNSTAAVTAPIVNAITIKGAASFDLNVGAIHAIKIFGALSDSIFTLTGGGLDLATLSAGQIIATTINSAGSLGSISAAALTNSTLNAGIAPLSSGQNLPASPADFAAQSTIAAVTIKKGPAAFADSDISAATIKKLSLGAIQFANNGAPFGVAAMDIASITSVDPSTGKSFTFKKLTSEDIVTADLTAKAIVPQDFVLRIVS